MSKGKRVVIAGAGCAGLSAGVALQKRGYHVTVLERSNRVGGLAGGIELGANTYEYGPHIFHTTDPEVMEDVQRIAGHVLIKFHKTIKIKFLGKYFDFPLSVPDVLTKLPFLTVLHALGSFVVHFTLGLLRGAKHDTDSEVVLRRYYGDVLYRLFFKDYIDKVWGIPPSGMAASFAHERVPKLDVFDVIDKFKKKFFGNRKKAVITEGYVEKVEGDNYTTKKGFALIAESFAEAFSKAGGELKLNTGVSAVRTEDKRVVSVVADDGTTHSCEHFISTVPVSLLPSMLEPKPPQPVIDAAAQLKFRAITFVGLLVRRRDVLPASFMYFRDKSFNRITDLGQFEVEVKPAGSTILIAEITCQPGEPLWEDDDAAQKGVVRELIEEGLIKAEDVLETHVFKTTFGYPIYRVGYEKALSETLEGLKAYENLHSIGRQGRFAYINTHIAMKMGYDAARKIQKLDGAPAMN
jgi:protoporphyrinogen oxidase